VKARNDVVTSSFAGVVTRAIDYELYQANHEFASGQNAVIQELLIPSYGTPPSLTSQSKPGEFFMDLISTNSTSAANNFAVTQQFFAIVPGTRKYRIQIEPCTANNTFGTATWQNVNKVSTTIVLVNNDPGSSTERVCSR
jgi:hypothetical protein